MQFKYDGNSKKSGVYKITNLTDGKVYIGSAKEFKRRGKQHLRSLEKGIHQNRHLQAAFNRDGTEAFLFEVLEVVPGEQTARFTVEQTYLDQYLEDWKLCYNFKKKTVAKSRSYASKTPEETFKKLSAASKKRWEDPEYRDMMINTMTGNKYCAGRKLSKEHIEAIRKANLGHKYNLGRKASEETRRKISKASKGRKLSAEAIENLRRVNTGKKHSAQARAKMSANNHMNGKVGSKHPRARKVLQYDMSGEFIREWASITEAAAALGLASSSNISSCARGTRKCVGGFVWRYPCD